MPSGPSRLEDPCVTAGAGSRATGMEDELHRARNRADPENADAGRRITDGTARLRTGHRDLDSLASAVAGVLQLHSADARYAAIAGLSICQECGKQWPCPTVQVTAEPPGDPTR